MDRREQIADSLGRGVKAVDIAMQVGCTPEYISELVKDDEQFRDMLREKMVLYQEERNDAKLKSLKEKAINAISENIGTAELSEQVKVLESISRIELARKSTVLPGTYTNVTQNINLTFKESSIPRLVTDSNNRVIAIGDQSIVPMPAKNVRDLFDRMDANGGKVVSVQQAVKEIENDHARDEVSTVTQAEPALAAAN